MPTTTAYLTEAGERVAPEDILGRRCTAFDAGGNCARGILTRSEKWGLVLETSTGSPVSLDNVEVVSADESTK